ncbi:MAG: hypothetical protein AAB354_01465 [candidate division KSB1 bacterium]
MLCARRPENWLPRAYVEAVRYRGKLHATSLSPICWRAARWNATIAAWADYF